MSDVEPTRRASRAVAAALAADYSERLVLGTVRDVHLAVSARTFGLLGPVAAPVRLVHEGVSGAVYGALGALLRGAGSALRRADARGCGGGPVEGDRAGRRLRAVVNGLFGESLEAEGHPLAVPLAARVDSRDVGDLGHAYPGATGDVVVFLHGLMEDDESWRWGGRVGGLTYAERLREETAWTPVTLRYNTGLPIARNGRLLSEWLDRLLDAWPVPVRRLALVGHSMGGLVALAACEQAGAADDATWTPLVRHVVCLGTPHLGAPLERLVHSGSSLLGAFPESTPFARILDTRSAGILDLRQAVVECTPLTSASYHCVSASLSGPLGLVMGDLLVRPASATGRIPGATVQHLAATHHFQLLNHPDVYADLRRRLTG